jgi:hypothetical protein
MRIRRADVRDNRLKPECLVKVFAKKRFYDGGVTAVRFLAANRRSDGMVQHRAILRAD